ncbi:MAG: PH domain-containing protein [Rhodobacteraceae bacterium]|nr:PH domain-containing protein [Paracoccaceae bacterium]
MPHDDFQTEPVRGLPELPPEGEHVLWQGAPAWWPLAKDALNTHWVALYFVLMALWQGIPAWADYGVVGAMQAAMPFAILGLIACGILMGMAVVFARTTVYTITNRRVAMRIGAALTVTLNIPHRWVGSADLKLSRDGTGTIALDLLGSTQLSYLVCWPHVRPWHIRKTQPAFRAIPDAARVADLLAHAAAARLSHVGSPLAEMEQTGGRAPVAAE